MTLDGMIPRKPFLACSTLPLDRPPSQTRLLVRVVIAGSLRVRGDILDPNELSEQTERSDDITYG